nr:MAG TPA: hypothetical protein [Caudoviricetes sp.]
MRFVDPFQFGLGWLDQCPPRLPHERESNLAIFANFLTVIA